MLPADAGGRGFLTYKGSENHPEGALRVSLPRTLRNRARAHNHNTSHTHMKRETKQLGERLRGKGERITLLLLILLSGWLGGAALYQTMQALKVVWEAYAN